MILDKLFESRAEAINLAHPGDPGLIELFGLGQDTIAGITVTERTALNYSAVYSAVKCIAETIGGLDRAVHEIADNGDSELLSGHPVTELINLTPNDNMTPAVFWETMQSYLLLWGNAYAEIERDRLGGPVALWPIEPSRVTVQRAAGDRLAYSVRSVTDRAEPPKTLTAADVLHVPCMGTGEVGVSVITYARESMAVGLGAERFGGAFFGNGAKVGGLLKLARPATRERKAKIAEDWKREFGGPANASRLAVIDHDSDYTQIGIPPEDAQFLQTREFQVQEVCRWFRISPTKLMDFSRATFSNIEEINKQYASETILPWAIKWAQECRRKLLDEGQRRSHAIRHDLSKLVEGDLDTLTQIFSRGRQWGWYSINDVRRKLGENTIGPDGDEYLTPQNMSPVGEEEEEKEEQPPGAPSTPGSEEIEPTSPNETQSRAIRSEFQSLRDELTRIRAEQSEARQADIQAVHRRFLGREGDELIARAKRPKDFWAKVDRYYGRLESKLAKALAPYCKDAEQRAADHMAQSHNDLLELAHHRTDASLQEDLERIIDKWASRYS